MRRFPSGPRSVVSGAVCAFIALLCSGCGKEVPSRQFTQSELDQMRAKRMKAVAQDMSLSDQAAIQKYIESLPLSPQMYVTGTTKLAEAKPAANGSGYVVEVRKYDQVFMGRTNKDGDMLQYERNTIKEAAAFCESALRELSARKLIGVRVRLYSMVSGKEEEVFVASAIPSHLARLQAASSSGPVPGSAVDPRGPGITQIWTVEKNIYPEIVYRKKT